MIWLVKLFQLRDAPDGSSWIGEDAHGALMTWPAEPGGWDRRTAWTGNRRLLKEMEPALARGTGWPGGGRAPKPRSANGEASNRRITLRATDAEADAWERLATDEGKGITVWARDSLNDKVKMRRLFDAISAGERVEVGWSSAGNVSGTLSVALRNAKPAQRFARIMRAAHGRFERVFSTSITDAQARELLAAGAVEAA